MSEQIKTYVAILYPGTLFEEDEVRTVSSRDISAVMDKLPKNAFAFYFFDQTSKEVSIEGKKRIIYGDAKNKSGRFFPGGIMYSLAQVEKMGPKYAILASNMRANNWMVVVKTRLGNFQPFLPKDSILGDRP